MSKCRNWFVLPCFNVLFLLVYSHSSLFFSKLRTREEYILCDSRACIKFQAVSTTLPPSYINITVICSNTDSCPHLFFCCIFPPLLVLLGFSCFISFLVRVTWYLYPTSHGSFTVHSKAARTPCTQCVYDIHARYFLLLSKDILVMSKKLCCEPVNCGGRCMHILRRE